MKKILISLLLIGLGIFLKTNTFGAELLAHWGIEPSGGGEFEYLINRPYSGETFTPGGEVRFQGYVTLPGCHNGLYYNKITFYVSEPEKLHYELENACNNCLGASSGYEGIIIPDDQSCQCTLGRKCGDEKGAFNCKNVYKDNCFAIVIDEDRKIPKFYKFGTTYPSDIPYKGHPARKTDKVEFNKTYTLPSDICKKLNLKEGEKNKVYFWIQYSGLHSDCAWHSAIVYQEGYIDCSTQTSLPPSPPPPPPEPEGIPPIAELIAPEIAIENTTVTLDGSKSRDPDGNYLDYSWGVKDWWGGGSWGWKYTTPWKLEVFGEPEIINSISPIASLKIPYLPIEDRLLPPEAFDYDPNEFLIPVDKWELDLYYYQPNKLYSYLDPLPEAIPPKSLVPYLPSGLVEQFKKYIEESIECFKDEKRRWNERKECFINLKSITGYFKNLKENWRYVQEREGYYSRPFPRNYGFPIDLEGIESYIEEYKNKKIEKVYNNCSSGIRVKLHVADLDGLVDGATALVRVLPFNLHPIAIIAASKNEIEIETPSGRLTKRKIFGGYEGETITLDGSYSFDPDGGSITKYQWEVGYQPPPSWTIGREGVKILNPEEKIVQIKLPHLASNIDRTDFGICLRVWDDENTPSPYECVKLWIYKKRTVTVSLTSDLTTDWIWQTKPLTLTWDSENASECRRWIEIWNPFENVKLKDTSLGDKIPYDNWTSDWNDQLSGTITTYPGSGPPDPQTGSQPRNWIGKLWIYKIECKDNSGNTKEAHLKVNVKPRPIWQEVFPF